MPLASIIQDLCVASISSASLEPVVLTMLAILTNIANIVQEEIQFRNARTDSPDSMLTYFQHQGSPVYFLVALIVCTHPS